MDTRPTAAPKPATLDYAGVTGDDCPADGLRALLWAGLIGSGAAAGAGLISWIQAALMIAASPGLLVQMFSWRVLLAPDFRNLFGYGSLAVVCIGCLGGRRWWRALQITSALVIIASVASGVIYVAGPIVSELAWRFSLASIPLAYLPAYAGAALKEVSALAVPIVLYAYARRPAGRRLIGG